MKIGFIGLGRMGANMATLLLEKKHKVVVHNRSPAPIKKIVQKGAIPAYTLEELVHKLPQRKIIFLMITAGKPIDLTIKKLIPLLKKGDIIIDGGNSFFKDSLRRHKLLKKHGIHFLDAGVSGGIEGARYGACIMVGGSKRIFKKVEKIFKDLTVKNGYGHMGEVGAGHFVKMVHNGIEYGMMSALAEGMQAIKKHKNNINIKEAMKVYAHGSIIESRLMSWMRRGYLADSFKHVSGSVPKGATEDEMRALEKMADMKVLQQARLMRVHSRKKPSFAGRLIATIRNQFGGHKFKKKNGNRKKKR